MAEPLHMDGWLDASDAATLRLLSTFGGLIGNSDMHAANVGLFLEGALPLRLVPAYDMLPMHYRPLSTGELTIRPLALTPPAPRHIDAWQEAARMATEFWRRVRDDTRLSDDLRREGARVLDAIAAMQDRAG